MIEKSLIISLLILSIHYTMLDGEIFEKLGKFFERVLPEQIHKPVFDCAICMSPWYGSILFWVIPWPKLFIIPNTVEQWPVCIIVAMGFNIVINKWAPKDCEEID